MIKLLDTQYHIRDVQYEIKASKKMLKCLLVTFLLTVSYKCVQCSTRLNFAPLFL